MSDPQSKKVLVVDDDLGELEALVISLMSWGYQPIPAVGPHEGIRAFSADREIRLVISDQGMMPLNGIQMIASLRETGRRFEAIIFTGGVVERLVPAAVAAGIRKVVAKPDYRWLHEELVAAEVA